MTLPDVVKESITIGDLKRELKKLKERRETLVVADVVAKHILIISNYLKKMEGVKEPTIDDILKYLEGAPDDLTLFSLDVPVGRPCFETATCIGFKWLYGLVVKPLRDKGWPVIDLQKDLAVRNRLLDAISSGTPYIKWLGHGNERVITGQNYDYITWIGDYKGGLAFKHAGVKVFSALSCITAKALGPWLVRQKYIEAYYGYDDTFVFAGGSESLERPFFDSDTTFDRLLIEGHTTGEGHDAAIERWDYWLNNPNTPSYIKAYLLHDKEHSKLIGADDIAPFEGSPPEPQPPEPEPPEERRFSFNFSWKGSLSGIGDGYVYIGRWKLPIKLKISLDGEGTGEGTGKEKSSES